MCDDGNLQSGDGCSATCQIENFASCGDLVINNGEECDDGPRGSDTCTTRCRRYGPELACGNGILETRNREQCDDGNTDAGDGCSPTCKLESTALCGDGIVQPETEQCDNGSKNSDAPSSCRLNCTLPFCGDGILDFNEQCDVGIPGQLGCSDTCELQLTGAPPPVISEVPPPPTKVPPPGRTPTGPGLVIFLASGAAAGFGLMRRRMLARK